MNSEGEHMREQTTIRLDRELEEKLKAQAVKEGKSYNQLIVKALRAYLRIIQEE